MADKEFIFLSPDEIKTLTGYTRQAEQRQQLKDMGINFEVNRLGRPIVLKATLLGRSGSKVTHTGMPDLKALEAICSGSAT